VGFHLNTANTGLWFGEHFSKLVKLGGQLVLSGILHEQLEIILDAYGEYFSELKVVQKEDWCRVNGIRK
jgi:ribosomal protein L11 methyltransferase